MAYDLMRIKREFNEVCEKAGCPVTIPIKLNGRLTRTLGRVSIRKDAGEDDWYPYLVEFSNQMLETSSDKTIKDVIMHEAAHYIVAVRTKEDHNHDAVFKAVCAEIGTTNDTATTKVDYTVAQEEVYKYSVYCPTCKETIGGFNRMCKTLKMIDQCTCKRCGGSGLTYKQNR